MVLDSLPISDAQLKFYSSDKELFKTFKIRRLIGRALSMIDHKKWVYWFDCLVRNPDMSGLIGIPTGRKRYLGEFFPSNVYLPTSVGTFEGNIVPLPGDWDKYLKNLYGDYELLPPEDKRERHFILELVIKDVK